ncbi:MAG: hypothetical protein KC469_07160 [Flavobacteriaceae bacterium]|nr:hypothetical protein [Flavobacteriaceae bacterium]
MIKFFRKIRYNLMEQNKTGKYFKYAIGEIILVVIGILIALSINNWNENNKKKNLEIDILTEVNMSLENDLIGVKQNLNDLKDKYISENIIIDWIVNKETFHDTLSRHINKIQFGIEFNYNGAPYETLKQLGMRTIKTDSLRQQISSLYDLTFDNYSALIKYQNDGIDAFHKLEAKYFNEIGFLNQNIMKPTNIVNLRNDNEFIFSLKSIRNYNEYIFEFLIPQVEIEIIKTKNMIEKEIEIRNNN